MANCWDRYMSPVYMRKRHSIRGVTLRVADMRRTMRKPNLTGARNVPREDTNHYADHTVHKERM